MFTFINMTLLLFCLSLGIEACFLCIMGMWLKVARWFIDLFRCVVKGSCIMDDIVDLSEGTYCPSTQFPCDMDGGVGMEFGGHHMPNLSTPTSTTGGRGASGRSSRSRVSPAPSQSQASPSQKIRGPNWTEAEMLVLIGQKRIEWDGRHNSNQPSLARFVYGTTLWKMVLARCMNVVGFKPRDNNQK